MNLITVIIAEDHLLFRTALISLFNNNPEIKIVSEAGNGLELIEQIKQHSPQIVLLDLEMPLMNGEESMMKIKNFNPGIKIIILSMTYDNQTILDFVEKGCNAFLSKNVDFCELVKTIKIVAAQGNYFSENIYSLIKDKLKKNHTIDFSLNEREIIRLIAQEYSSAQIADSMNLGKRTIENYRSKILSKMNVKNVAGLLRYAKKNRFID